MANPYHHALSSVKQYGGIVEDYQAIHDWFDKSKAQRADPLHRALRHHSEGIFTCEEVFGNTIALSTCAKCGDEKGEHWEDGDENLHVFSPKIIPTRWIGEQHVREDLGFIPTANQWLDGIPMQPWMTRSRKLSKELDAPERREYNDGPKDAAWHEAQRADALLAELTSPLLRDDPAECDECGELERHGENCSLHPDNIVEVTR